MIGLFDPGHDREAQLLSGGPAAGVEDVLLQQREERLHRCVVSCGADASHRADEVEGVECGDELSGPELAASVAVDDAAADRGQATVGDGVGEGVDGERCLHPVADRVADDPVGADVLDRAEVEPALTGPVLGDVGQPQSVRGVCGEVALDPVVVEMPACEQSRHAPFTGPVANCGQLAGDEAVVGPRVVGLDLQRGVGEVASSSSRVLTGWVFQA